MEVNIFSIRDKKKLQTSTAILQSAKRLFTHNGYEQTTMEQIAEDAIVSIGTLYNYYASKGDILVAIMAEHAIESLNRGHDLLTAKPEDPVKALSEMVARYTEVFLSLDSRLLGKSLSLALENPSTMGQRLFSIDLQMITQVQESIIQMQEQGHLSPSLHVQDIAYLLYSMGFMAILLSYAGVLPSLSTEEYITRQVDHIIKPWLAGEAKKG
ncbi:MAG: TetR/AcrR family transcriptional regulator [Syntrophomonadaceae bacterium]|nr:TetR/AcrR family transcriptional regulator [Syntrophomonadaceae bacterium]